MDNHRLRAIILRLQDRLSNDDRKRLHFYLGNDVPRRIRDDPSLGGTLSLMDSLFDQDKINEKDFTFLINAFDEIHCIDAVKLLREHWRQSQSKELNQSIESLSMIMPPMVNILLQDQDEDKYCQKNPLLDQKNTCGNNNTMINSNNANINQMPTVIYEQKILHSGSRTKQILNSKTMYWKCLLIFVLLSILGYGVLLLFFVKNIIQIDYLRTSNNQHIEIIQQLENQMKQLKKNDGCNNFVIKQNWNYNRNDLGEATKQTAYADCCAQCSKDDKCNAFTWNRDTQNCLLKSNIDNGGQSDSSVVAGHRLAMNSIPARSTGISTEPRIDWKGNDLATSCNFRGNDFLDAQVPVENCRSKCAETVGCTHFTWTQFNGGTCWMKRGLVSKNDAFYNNDSSMVCGVINNCLPGSTGLTLPWHKDHWAHSCNFCGNDLSNAKTSPTLCGSECTKTLGCTHFTWTEFNGGTCWMKKGPVSKNEAFPTNDSSMICGVINVCLPGNIGSTLPWDGNNSARSCDFCGNDLSNVKTSSEFCGSKCAEILECTHFTWTEFNGGTCWMKKGPVSKDNAFLTNDSSMICGVIKERRQTRAIGDPVSEIHTRIYPWDFASRSDDHVRIH